MSWKCWASFHPRMIILPVFGAKILRRVETCEKIIKMANHCLLFLPTADYNRDLRAHKIKRITNVKGAVTVSCSKSLGCWKANLSLVVLIKFVLIMACCQLNKLHFKSYPTYCPHIYREILLTRQVGKHSLNILSQIVHCYKNRLCIA